MAQWMSLTCMPMMDCRQAWAEVAAVHSPHWDFADRWGSADFTTYVDALKRQADQALQEAGPVSNRTARHPLGVRTAL